MFNETEKTLIIPRMETIKKTAEIFGLPVHFVRTKVSSGEVVAVRAGRRFLVNVDKFAEYLNSSTISPDTESDEAAKVGRVYPINLRR
ncbi:MAG TPA: hypothetical protein DDX91_04730 [Ruminococcaceae bacterium]|nr:hypothetical protein [Oscillospiraceae bacterium]